ncbi:hypothetical protein [Nocardia camponoti]|nr:hypothetical protein [Nocardia camponoti]
MAMRAPDGTMLGQIHAYADTMFNSHQLRMLVAEIATLSPVDPEEAATLDELAALATDAIGQHGYLWFCGD